MKILLPHRVGGAFGHITDSWLAALLHAGFDTRRYDGQISSWLDFKPDLYIGCSGHRQQIPGNSGTKIAIHVNPFGVQSIPGINESDDAIDWVCKQRPTTVFGYGFEAHRPYWSKWETKCRIPWTPMPTGADYCKYKDKGDDRPYDIVYLGGRWSYKAKTIDRYLLPLFNINDIKYRVAGWGDWPPELNVQELPLNQENDFFNSGMIGPCMSEPHTHVHGIDLPERAFKLALCGTMFIHDAKLAVSMLETAVAAEEPDEYLRLHRYFINMPEKRESMARMQRFEILSAHTYHHRLALLLHNCGFSTQSKHLLSLVI